MGVGIGPVLAMVAGPTGTSLVPNHPTPRRPTTASCALPAATAVAGRPSLGSPVPTRPRGGIVVVAPTPTVASCASAGDAVTSTAVDVDSQPRMMLLFVDRFIDGPPAWRCASVRRRTVQQSRGPRAPRDKALCNVVATRPSGPTK